MVKYYGRARTRTGSVNTNQLGLKMSGCPSTVGKQGRIARYMGRRVDCMMGLCKPIRYHEVLWPRTRMRNQPRFCKPHATKCMAAAGGVGTNHNIPYYRIPKQGESGCTPTPPYNVLQATLTAATLLGGAEGYSEGVGGSLSSTAFNGSTVVALSSDTAAPQPEITIEFDEPTVVKELVVIDQEEGKKEVLIGKGEPVKEEKFVDVPFKIEEPKKYEIVLK